jgi:hypothetical protein
LGVWYEIFLVFVLLTSRLHFFHAFFYPDNAFLHDIQGAEELAASAFAFMFAMVTAWVMALGGSTALGE